MLCCSAATCSLASLTCPTCHTLKPCMFGLAVCVLQGFKRFDELRPHIKCPPHKPLKRYGGATGASTTVPTVQGVRTCIVACLARGSTEQTCKNLTSYAVVLCWHHMLAFCVCVVMWGGRSFGLHTPKVT
jgi:hypothetical protein